MNVGTLTIFLGVTTSGINKAIRDANRLERSVVASAGTAQEALLSFGRVATQFLTFPLSIIGGVATKTFSDFEHNLAKVTGLVGIASNQTKEWGEELKDLASAVGKSPKELSEALYFVTTGGIRGAETMDVLTVSAKAAAAGLGETQQVTDLLVSAINAYGKENLSAARAADILVASVKEGKAEAPALAQSMGIVLPIASKLGVTFDQVGAAMAGMTRTGTKASTAAMQTRQILNKIVKPAEQSKEAIKKVGTSFEELRHIIGTQGLLPALMKLNDLTKEYGVDTMADIFPNIRALSGILDLLGANLDENIKSQEAITNSAGALDHAFATVAKTWKFQLNQAIKEGQTLMVELGEAIAKTLTPTIKNIFDSLSSLVSQFTNLTSAQQGSIIKIGLLTVALGPLIILFNILRTSIIIPLISLYFSLEKSMGAVLDKTALGVHQLGKYVYKTRENIVVQKQQTSATRVQTVAAQQQNVATETLIASTTALSTVEKTYSGTLSYVTQSENGSVAAKKALIFVIRETFAALTEGITTSNAYAISLTRIAQALDYNIARFQYLANQYVLLTTSVNLNSKALDYNVARYVRIQTALNILNAEIQRGVQVIAMHTVTLSNHQKALGYDAARYATLIAIIQKHTGVLGLNIAALDQQMVNFQLLTNQKMIDTSVTEIVIFKNSQLVASFTAVSTQVALLKYELALLNKTYTLFSSQLMMGAAPAVKQLAAHQAQLALGMGTVLKTHISWKAFQLDFISKMKAMGAAILQFTKYLGLMAARFAMTSGYIAIYALLGTALVGLIKKHKDASAAQKALNDTNKEAARIYAQEAQTLNKLASTVQSEYTSKDMRAQAIIRLNNMAPEYLRNLTEENARTEEGIKLIDDYRDALERKGKAQAANNALIELEQRRIEDLATGANKMLTFWERAEKVGTIQALTGRNFLYNMFGGAGYEALRVAQDEIDNINEKVKTSEAIYNSARDAYILMLNSSKYALSDFVKQYDLLSEKTKQAEKNDKMFAKTVISDIKKQMSAMDEYITMLRESFGILKKQGKFEEMGEILIEIKGTQKVQSDMGSLLTIIEALLPNLFDLEEYTESAAGKLDKLFEQLRDDMSSAQRGVILFGDSYNLINKQLGIYKSLLESASKIEGSTSDQRIKNAKLVYTFLLRTTKAMREMDSRSETMVKYNEDYIKSEAEKLTVMDNTAQKLEVVQSLYDAYLIQLFNVQKGLGGFTLSLDSVKQALEFLTKAGLTSLPVFKALQDAFDKMSMYGDMSDVQGKLDELHEKFVLLGGDVTLLQDKVSLLRRALSTAMSAPLGTTEEERKKWLEDVKMLRAEYEKTKLAADTYESVQNGVVDMFVELGRAATGASDAMDNMKKIIKRVMDDIYKSIVKHIVISILRETKLFSFLSLKQDETNSTLKNATAIATETAAIVANTAARNANAAAGAGGDIYATGDLGGVGAGAGMAAGLSKALGWIGLGIGVISLFGMLFKRKKNKMAAGGVVPPGYPNDSYPAMLTSGETVIPPKKLPKFEDRDVRVHVLMEGKVKGRDLYYIMKEEERVIGNSF